MKSRARVPRYLVSGSLAGLSLSLLPAVAAGVEVHWGSIERAHGHAAERGPQSKTAPLPPRGPIAPGEALRDTSQAGAAPAAPTEQAPARPATPKAPTGSSAAPAAPPRAQAERQRPIASDSERPVPDYESRPQKTTVGDVAIWVPRVVLSPLYLVSEYVVRRPLGYAITEAERHHWPEWLFDVFTWQHEQAGLVPHGMVDFGLRPSVGLYLFWDHFLADRNELRSVGATGGRDWWRLTVTDRITTTPGQKLVLRGELNLRPDWVFCGLGPESPERDRSRYKRDLYEAALGYTVDLWRTSTFESAVALRDVRLEPSIGCCGDRTLTEALAAGLFPPPPVLDGYTVLVERASLTLDTRKERFPEVVQTGLDFVAPPGTGAKLALRGSHSAGERREGAGPDGSERLQWLDYGATLGGYIDVTGYQRTLGLELVGDFADPAGHHEIPFTELPSLGGYEPLLGFLPRRLVGRSAISARLSYTWPIWVLLDGVIRYEVGNVFGEHLAGFQPKLLRSSYSIGLGASNRRDHNLELLVALGTKTFQEHAGYDYLRVYFGTTTNF
jgi:hypothetical protein